MPTEEVFRDMVFKSWGDFLWDVKEMYIALCDVALKDKSFHVDTRMDPFQRLMSLALAFQIKGIINRREVMTLLNDAIRVCEPPSQRPSKFSVNRRRRFSRIDPD